MKRPKNILNKVKCLLFGHVESNRDTIFTDVYAEEPYGAFYRSHRYVYNGRLYRCKRCKALIHVHGILSWEIVDLITMTLEDLPPCYFEDVFSGQDYEFCRIYSKPPESPKDWLVRVGMRVRGLLK